MNQDDALSRMKRALIPGQAYRRSDFKHMTTNVDRYLAALLQDGSLKKLQRGLYVCPQQAEFGEPPPEQYSLLRSFLKDDHFSVFSKGDFNALGLGSTQLYAETIVFNRKRNGRITLGKRTYLFHKWREAPKNSTKEFLLVQMLNRLEELAEDHEKILQSLGRKIGEFNARKLHYALKHYGTISAQLKFNRALAMKAV